jgi:hypothetical protein
MRRWPKRRYAAHTSIKYLIASVGEKLSALATSELYRNTILNYVAALATSELYTNTILNYVAPLATSELHTNTILNYVAAPATSELYTITNWITFFRWCISVALRRVIFIEYDVRQPKLPKWIVSAYVWAIIGPIYSRTSIIRDSINRASHRYAVPLHFQCAGGVVSG